MQNKNFIRFIFRNEPSDLLIRKPVALPYDSGVNKIIFLSTPITTGNIFSRIQFIEEDGVQTSLLRPMLECFGENVTNITNDIFDVNGSESNYKTILKKLSAKMSFDDVVNIFNGALSFNAMIYLKGCYKDE